MITSSTVLRAAARLPAAWRHWPQCTVLRLWSRDRPPTDWQRIQPPYNRKGLAWSICETGGGQPMRHSQLSNEQILLALSESYNVVAAITKYQVFLTSAIGLPKR
jgi:hypothetical protein